LESDGKGRLSDVDLGVLFFEEQSFADAVLVNDRFGIYILKQKQVFKELCLVSPVSARMKEFK
jgi:hypothetical protein